MFLCHVLEWLCTCSDGYLCLKVESFLHSDMQYWSKGNMKEKINVEAFKAGV